MLGASLCSLFHPRHVVHAIHRSTAALAPCAFDLSCDLLDRDSLALGLAEFKPDLLIHCAACVDLEVCERDPEFAYQSNVHITKNVVAACPSEASLIYISTDQVYGDNPDHSEMRTDLQPLNAYGRTKLEGERVVLESDMRSLVIRTNIFGTSTKPGQVNSTEWMMNALKEQKAITLFKDYVFSPIYTEFLGRKLLELIELQVTGVFNLGARTPCTKYQFGVSLAEIMGVSPVNLISGSLIDFQSVAKRSHDLSLHVSKVGRLGISLPTYQESLHAYYEKQLEESGA